MFKLMVFVVCNGCGCEAYVGDHDPKRVLNRAAAFERMRALGWSTSHNGIRGGGEAMAHWCPNCAEKRLRGGGESDILHGDAGVDVAHAKEAAE